MCFLKLIVINFQPITIRILQVNLENTINKVQLTVFSHLKPGMPTIVKWFRHADKSKNFFIKPCTLLKIAYVQSHMVDPWAFFLLAHNGKITTGKNDKKQAEADLFFHN